MRRARGKRSGRPSSATSATDILFEAVIGGALAGIGPAIALAALGAHRAGAGADFAAPHGLSRSLGWMSVALLPSIYLSVVAALGALEHWEASKQECRAALVGEMIASGARATLRGIKPLAPVAVIVVVLMVALAVYAHRALIGGVAVGCVLGVVALAAVWGAVVGGLVYVRMRRGRAAAGAAIVTLAGLVVGVLLAIGSELRH